MSEEKNLFPAVVKKEMMVLKRRVPMNQPYIKGEDAKRASGLRNQQIFFYKFFETRVPVKRGEVYLSLFTSIVLGLALLAPPFPARCRGR